MKKRLFFMLFALASISVFTAKAQFSGNGAGTQDSPYEITTAAQLNEVRNSTASYYKLMDDIDLSIWDEMPTEGWNPIPEFAGVLDGNGHVISGFWIDRPTTDNVGFINSFKGTIKKLGVIIPENKVVKGKNTVGGLVAQTPYASSSTAPRIEECFVAGGGTIEGTKTVGGMLGQANCISDANKTTIINSYVADITVMGGESSSGFVGNAYRHISLTNCYSTANVIFVDNDPSKDNFKIAGLVGYMSRGSAVNQGNHIISNCAAINPNLLTNEDAGRIYGGIHNEATLSISGCIAFNEMKVKDALITDGAADNNNGLNKTKAELKLQSTYEGWDFDNVWTMGNGNYTLPILKGIAATHQPTVTPSHLADPGNPVGMATAKESPVSIYPGITGGEIFISNKAASSIVSVYDFTGRVVLQSDASVLDISSFTNGIYLIEVENKVVKIIKK